MKSTIIPDDVLSILADVTCDGDVARIEQKLDRKLYVRVNDILMAAGGTWNRHRKGHVFDGDAAEIIEAVVMAGEITRPKDLDFFETPPDVAACLALWANLPDHPISVLEPSAGRGAIARVLAERHATTFCFEINPAHERALLDTPRVAGVAICDFLECTPEPIWQRIVMNPPFSKRQDIHHVLHALKFLAPGGRLVAVMSKGVQFRQDRLATDFRRILGQHNGTMVDLDDGAFKPSGTMVRTVAVTAERP